MLLQGKNAIIYGGGGEIGGTVARAFAEAGARVFLAGRTQASLDVVANDIRGKGGSADTSIVDALDEQVIDRHVDAVAEEAGRIDITFNAIECGGDHGTHAHEMALDGFLCAVNDPVKTNFLTSRSAARYMVKQGSGVLMTITANVARAPSPNVGSFGVACAAVEALYRQFAVELGPRGIRTSVLRAAGSPDTKGLREAFEVHAAKAGITREELEKRAAADIPLRRLPGKVEVANAAVLIASDRASAMTATAANLTCGSVVD